MPESILNPLTKLPYELYTPYGHDGETYHSGRFTAISGSFKVTSKFFSSKDSWIAFAEHGFMTLDRSIISNYSITWIGSISKDGGSDLS